MQQEHLDTAEVLIDWQSAARREGQGAGDR